MPKKLFRRRLMRQEDRRGAATVEFALIAPLFFLLVLGSIEIGRALMVQQVLTNASRVGAREASLLNGTSAAAQAAASDYAASATVPGISVSISPDPSEASAGQMIQVTTSIDFMSTNWSPSPWFMGGQILTAQSSMRKEGFD